MTALETVFLDRDGTINVKAPQGSYITDPEQLVLLPGAAQAIRWLNERDIRTLVVTNQRGIAMGLMTASDLERIHDRLDQLLAREQARVDAIYTCPHDRHECTCRKPQPGLVHAAMRQDSGIRLSAAAVVGDADSDVELGLRLGMRTVQIVGEVTESTPRAAAQTAPDLLSAVACLLSQFPKHVTESPRHRG